MGWRNKIIILGLLGFLSPLGCGDVTFFFFWNTSQIEESRKGGLVIIVGTPREKEPKSVRLVEGEIPKGMKLNPDGTIQGVPEETGFFEITIEITEQDGTTEKIHYEIELEG